MSDVDKVTEQPLRSRAIAVLKKRRDFRAHLLVYVLVNSSLVAIWAMGDHDTFFWPIFAVVFWGIGVVMNAWDAYLATEFSEEEIQRQMRRLEGRN